MSHPVASLCAVVDRRYQVFVSSTYVDLVEERREVMQALLELDCLPAGMELFPAADEDQWTLIKEVIDQSDYYVVIVGGRYGSTTPEGLSYTEKEYDYAVEQGVPVVGFVHADPELIPLGKSEADAELREKLTAFRDKVMSRVIKKYTTPTDLGSVVSRGLTRLIKKHPRSGWVRGDQAMTPETRTEIAELRAELAAFKVAKAEAAAEARNRSLDLNYAHGDELVELAVTYRGLALETYDRMTYTGVRIFTWDDLIHAIGPYMLDEAPEERLRELLENYIVADIESDDENGWTQLHKSAVDVSDGSWGDVLVQLRALGVIEVGTKKRVPSDKSVYWRLTSAGDDYLVGLRAVPSEVLVVASEASAD